MSDLLSTVQTLVAQGDVQPSLHAYRKLLAEGLLYEEIVDGLKDASTIETYPDAFKGPSVLVLQPDREGRPVHALWGWPRDHVTPAILITVYRPDATLWTANFIERRMP